MSSFQWNDSPSYANRKYSRQENSLNQYLGNYDKNQQKVSPVKKQFAYVNLNKNHNDFNKKQLSSYAMSQSIETESLQLVESQIIKRRNLNPQHNVKPYFDPFKAEQFPFRQGNHVYEKIKLQQMASSSNSKQSLRNQHQNRQLFDNIFTSTPQKVFESQQISSSEQIKLDQNARQNSSKSFRQNQSLDMKQTPNKLIKPSGLNQKIVDEQISQVKYRLDELMKKFTVNQNYQLVQANGFKKKQHNYRQKTYNSQAKRSRSSDQEKGFYEFKLKKKNTIKQINDGYTNEKSNHSKTEDKIKVRKEIQIDPIAHSQSLVMTSHQKQKNHSLNLSYSAASNEKILPNPHIESLYSQINEQQKMISAFKEKVSRLQTQRSQLLQIIQTEIKAKQQILNREMLLQHDRSDQFHRFQVETSPKKNTNQRQLDEKLPIYSPQKNRQNTTNEMDTLSLEKKVDILQAEKEQLLNKIDWLNGVVEEMMNMGSRVKNDKPVIPENANNTAKHYQSRHNSEEAYSTSSVKKQQKQLQTSFISVPLDQNSPVNHYKQLYERSLQNQSLLNKQMNQLQALQGAYSQQFKMILQEINEIKQNRSYYQKLKRQTKRTNDYRGKEKIQMPQYSRDSNLPMRKARSGAKKINKFPKQYNSSDSPEDNFKNLQHNKQRPDQTKIFENYLIYQLKKQNQMLRDQNRELKFKYVKQNEQINLPTPRYLKLQEQQGQIYSPIVNMDHSKHTQILKNDKISREKQLNGSRYNHNKRTNSYGDFYFSKADQKSRNSSPKYLKQNNVSPDLYSVSLVYDNSRASSRRIHQKVKSNRKKHTQNEQILLSKSNDHNIYSKFTSKSKNRFLQDGNDKQNMRISSRICEQKQKNSKQKGRQVEKKVINRYNNFIRHLKQRFGIDSAIIGKSIIVNDLLNS